MGSEGAWTCFLGPRAPQPPCGVGPAGDGGQLWAGRLLQGPGPDSPRLPARESPRETAFSRGGPGSLPRLLLAEETEAGISLPRLLFSGRQQQTMDTAGAQGPQLVPPGALGPAPST